MKKIIYSVLTIAVLVLSQSSANAQLLKKLKDKVTKVLNPPDTTANSSSTNNSSSSSGSPTNRTGAGLTNTAPPDVMQQINDAEAANKSANYSGARFAIQQALMGVEIQMGHEILQSLPATVDSLTKDTMQDKVMSTSYGWNNLTIQRIYSDRKDKQLTINIGNNFLYASLINVYFNNMYVQQNVNDPHIKQTMVKGNKSVIQFDESKGYTLIISIGQTSTVVLDCVNFATEAEVMSAANTFDLDGIKKMMGEQ